jgi:malate dehydrogenase (oxaloacetate-decarboxylating)
MPAGDLPAVGTAATEWDAALSVWVTRARGRAVLADRRMNKGTAFTTSERRELDLVGLLPPRVLNLGEQAERAYDLYRGQPTDLAQHIFLTELHDRNEVLFYRLLTDHLAEMLPIVYTPTVGEAIERYSHEYRRPHGVYLSVDAPEEIERSLRVGGGAPEDIDLIVATDAEAILGIGDWGVGGIEIAVGKLAVYTAAAGIDPARTLAVMLDVGTNRNELLADPLYLGNQHPRVGTERYDEFIEAYVRTANRLFPNALLHWEDFGASNARRIVSRYRDEFLTFNDDMQGTGAVTLACVLSALRVAGTRPSGQRVVVFGAGTAGVGIADQLRDALVRDGLSPDDATRQLWCLGRHGLLTDDRTDMRDFQRPYARPSAEVTGWEKDDMLGGIPLSEVVHQVHPTILIGTSGQPRAFTESIVREMGAHCARPIILPMSNPTSLAEALPADLIAWTDGKGLVASGSPFPEVTYEGATYAVAQANNALVFPGLTLGALVARAGRMTDGMFRAAAEAIAGLIDPSEPGGALLPRVDDLRSVSIDVAVAVALAARDEGVAAADVGHDLTDSVRASMWEPRYHPVRAI